MNSTTSYQFDSFSSSFEVLNTTQRFSEQETCKKVAYCNDTPWMFFWYFSLNKANSITLAVTKTLINNILNVNPQAPNCFVYHFFVAYFLKWMRVILCTPEMSLSFLELILTLMNNNNNFHLPLSASLSIWLTLFSSSLLSFFIVDITPDFYFLFHASEGVDESTGLAFSLSKLISCFPTLLWTDFIQRLNFGFYFTAISVSNFQFVIDSNTSVIEILHPYSFIFCKS